MPDKAEIVLDPQVLAGKPVISGTRISVEFILELMAGGWTVDGITREFPTATPEGIAAALRYAHDVISSERVYPAA